ncbi:core wall protein [Brazilian porcupinepox virus 1]|nr:core wall protein [Brazilian porcupinepox virus 1]
MMPINTVTTLDQLEDSEYLFKVVSTILPAIRLDYKVDENLKTTYVHPFDILLNSYYGNVTTVEEAQSYVEQIGINYLLDIYSTPKVFETIVNPGHIDLLKKTKSTLSNNSILNTHTFNDLPRFTRHLVMNRLEKPEYISRFIGGYVVPESGGFNVSYEDRHYPYLSFENTYILNLLYDDVIPTNVYGFRVRKNNGTMFYRDFENLLGVRKLLSRASIARFDTNFEMAAAANSYNVQLPQPEQPADLEFVTLSIKHLVLYFQYFSINYTLANLTYNGDVITNTSISLASVVASIRFQEHIFRLHSLYPELHVHDDFDITVNDQAGNAVTSTINLNIKFVDISARQTYYILLLNMIAKEARANKTKQFYSMFWDGIDYNEYKSKTFTDIIFYNSTCYVFGLYNKNNTTYCSLLSDIIKSNEIPLRVCFLPRTLASKTVPSLIHDILENVNNISKKDFPKRTSTKVMHIGLSENNFMRFFQLLRLFTNKDPEVSIKEILLLYVGFKFDDTGSPHMIKKESYQDFCVLLFSAMGFKVNVRKSIIGSSNHTVINIRPKVTKQYIHNMLMKSGYKKDEADKIISASHDLLNFMVTTSDYKSYQDYYYTRNFFPSFFFYGGGSNMNTETVDETTIHISEPMNILDRINIRGIFSANTLDEVINVDAFGPENTIFKSNLYNLIKTDNLSGDSIVQTMPLNILDKLVTVAGAQCGTVSFNELIDNITSDTDDCDSTSDITELINSALKDNYVKKNTTLVTQAFNSVVSHSQKQLNDIKQVSCNMASIFKELSRSIYTVERIFNAKLSDDIKVDILEKLKAFSNISKSLYKDLISIESLKAMLYIIKRNGRNIDDTEINSNEIRKSYEIIKPKIVNMTNYYTDMNRAYFEFIKKNLNMNDGSLISFDRE